MSGVAAEARPRLAPGVRLRQDRLTGRYLLLRPEKGFELRGAALEIVRLCDGAATVAGIVERLAGEHADVPRARLTEDVMRLLDELRARGLIALDAGGTGA